MDLTGKNIVISGGSTGIGFGTCKQLLQNNIKTLVILDIKEIKEQINELKKINKMSEILFLKTDVTDKQNVEDSFKIIVDKFNTIDIVLANAGRIGEDNMELTMNVNFFGCVYVTLTAMNCMSKSKGGNGGIIMATSSIGGLVPFFPNPSYVASKHAVIGFYRSLSYDYYFKKHNIKFILMCPGSTETQMMDNLEKTIFDPDSVPAFREYMKGSPIQSVDTLGKLMVDVLKIGENGSAWIAYDGKISQVEFKEYSYK